MVDFNNTEKAFGYLSNADLLHSIRVFSLLNNKPLSNFGQAAAMLGLKLKLPVEWVMKPLVFRQFVGGETLAEVSGVVQKLASNGVDTILEFGIEALSSEAAFDKTLNEKLKILEFSTERPNLPVVSCKVTALGRFSLFEKIHKGETLTHSENEELERVRERMNQLSQRAWELGKSFFFDAEETWIQAPLDDLITQMMERWNKERVVVYNTYQLYVKGKPEDLKVAHQKAREGNYLLGAKLVRGAYVEKERSRANQMGYPSPICDTKEETDRSFDHAVTYCIENLKDIGVYLATHNENSCALACSLMEKMAIPANHPHVLFAQLYGMGDHLTFNLADAGYNTSKYIPYGPLKQVMPYLIRRAEENSSVSGQMGRELTLLRKEAIRRKLI